MLPVVPAARAAAQVVILHHPVVMIGIGSVLSPGCCIKGIRLLYAHVYLFVTDSDSGSSSGSESDADEAQSENLQT